MISKIFEFRAAGTFIVIMATQLCPSCEVERKLLGSAGYGVTFHSQSGYIMLQTLDGGIGKATTDPYEHEFRDMTIAHEYIIAHFEALNPGAVIDVEYIQGLTEKPKEPDRQFFEKYYMGMESNDGHL
jgi:hypothetical protein